MIKTFSFLLLLTLSGGFCLAQEHNLTGEATACRLAKGAKKYQNAEGRQVCYACVKDDEKEREARIKEDKRRDAVLAAKWKEEKRLKDIADKKKRDEDAAKNKVTEVYIRPLPTATGPAREATDKKAAIKEGVFFGRTSTGFSSVNDHNYQSDYFLNRRGDTILRNPDWYSTMGVNDWSYPKVGFPAGYGVVQLKKRKTLDGKQYDFPIADLVDARGKRLFNNDSITGIVHFTHDWFIICKQFYEPPRWGYNGYSVEDAIIYNVKTKEIMPIPKTTEPYPRWPKFYMFTTESLIEDQDKQPKGSFNLCLSIEYARGKYTLYYARPNGQIDVRTFRYNY